MKLTVIAGTVAGLLALSSPAYAAPTVTVRVEGANATLLGRTSVTLGTGANGSPCDADTAGAALDAATNGNWDRQEFVQTILGETHKFELEYEHTLVGPYPERADLYKERSPIHFTDRISTPMLVRCLERLRI